MRVDVKDSTGAAVLYPATFGQRGQMVGPQALIRNSRVKSDEHGLLNERRHQNVIDSNLDWYAKSRAQEDADSLFGNTHNPNYGHDNAGLLPDNPFLQYDLPNHAGTILTKSATTRRAEIPVAWKHIDQFASISQFPNMAMGELSYHMEFEDQFNTVAPAVMSTMAQRCDAVTAAGNLIGDAEARELVTSTTRSNFNRPPMVGDKVTFWLNGTTTGGIQTGQAVISSVRNVDPGNAYGLQFVGGIATTAAAEVCQDIMLFFDYGSAPLSGTNYTPAGTYIGADADPITIADVYGAGSGKVRDMHKCPLYVGARVQVTAYRADNTTVYRGFETVHSLRKVGTGLEVTVNGGTGLFVGASNPISDIRIAFCDHDNTRTLFSATWTVDEVYAEMHEIQLMPSQLDAARKALADLEIPWMEQRLIQKNMPSTSVHTEVVEVDPSCAGVAVLTPQNLELLSGFDGCSSYRFALDGKETTNRDILCGTGTTVGRQIHNHLLKTYWANIGKQLKKYDANFSNYASPDSQRTHSFFPQVTPLVPNSQTLQLQLFAGSNQMASKNIFIVSTHQRALKISNGRVSIV
jgi:hypothetical protein